MPSLNNLSVTEALRLPTPYCKELLITFQYNKGTFHKSHLEGRGVIVNAACALSEWAQAARQREHSTRPHARARAHSRALAQDTSARKPSLGTMEKMTISDRPGASDAPVPPPVPPRTAPARTRHVPTTRRVPSQSALEAMLAEEEQSELLLVRRGERSAISRINYLKASLAARERHNELLSGSLTLQSELLHDVSRRVATMVKALGPPESLDGSPSQQALAIELLQLQRRIARGVGAAKAAQR